MSESALPLAGVTVIDFSRLFPGNFGTLLLSALGADVIKVEDTNRGDGIRDMLVFSEQDVIKDPPFSKLDLISCRNLMIYLNADLQKRLIPLFHYALKPNGMLFLGSSEGVGDFGDLFAALDRKAKLYRRKTDALVMRLDLR